MLRWQVDAGLRQLRFRIVPRHVNEERFWGRYFAACASIRAEVLQQQPCAAPATAATASSRRAHSSTGAATPAAQHPPAAPASIALQGSGSSSYAAQDMQTSDAAALMPAPATPATAAQLSGAGGCDSAHNGGAAAGSPKALWPDMTGSRFLGGGGASPGSAPSPAQLARSRVTPCSCPRSSLRVVISGCAAPVHVARDSPHLFPQIGRSHSRLRAVPQDASLAATDSWQPAVTPAHGTALRTFLCMYACSSCMRFPADLPAVPCSALAKRSCPSPWPLPQPWVHEHSARF